MKTLKALEAPERRRRHKMILDTFERHAGEGLPWMSRMSANDPDVIMDITKVIREPVGVYSWGSPGNWVSISITQISQSISGDHILFEFGKGQIGDSVQDADGFILNDTLFRCHPKLSPIYMKLVEDLEEIANAPAP